MREHTDSEVVIIGAGPVGCVLAGLLGRAGISTIVLDARPARASADQAGSDPRALAITLASSLIMRHIGLWQALPTDKIGLFRKMHVWDENGSGNVWFDCAELCQPTLGYIVEQSVLQHYLDELLNDLPGLEVHNGISIGAIMDNDKTSIIALEDGRRFSTNLIVAADGFNSQARQLAGIEYRVHDYQQHAVACVINTELSHDNIARQRFLSTGPLAFLPMADAHQCGIVWSTGMDKARSLQDMDKDEFHHELCNAFDNTLGAVTDSGPRLSFPLRRAHADSYCKNRFVLIGDAAHCVHPLAGLGANLGLLDAASLAEVIITARENNKDIGSLHRLRRYERWRKGENFSMMMVIEAFKYLFENQRPPLPTLRNKGMAIFNSMGLVKHQVMKRAMGLGGDLPDIVKLYR